MTLEWATIPQPCWAQIKLYLKDGSYQLVKSYEVKGDRVRYYSIERSEWEEVPSSLVDFKATRQAEAEKKQNQQEILQEAEKTEKDTYRLPPNTGYQVSPGVRLPQGEGVYAYDGTRVIALIQSQGSLVRDNKRRALNMAIPAPILKSRSLVILPGKEAAVRIGILNSEPVFYAQFADGAGANMELLRLKSRKDDREVEGIESRSGGQADESRSALPLDRTRIAPGLFRLKPAQPLRPGEYAFAEINQDKLDLDVWDFGVDSPNPEPRR